MTPASGRLYSAAVVLMAVYSSIFTVSTVRVCVIRLLGYDSLLYYLDSVDLATDRQNLQKEALKQHGGSILQ